MSYTTTQYVAAAAVPESCAVAPAWVLTDAFVSNEHDAPLGMPTPRPASDFATLSHAGEKSVAHRLESRVDIRI